MMTEMPMNLGNVFTPSPDVCAVKPFALVPLSYNINPFIGIIYVV